ncbi:hypothetical protein K439DRAFT_1661961 [Ramaria rubella]|nr:hypothetical protein K439DRAFT_1661961 [Ramaria rubella]
MGNAENNREVKIFKTKDCPMLTAGRITPEILQLWGLACERYMKHAEKGAGEIVSFVAEAMMEPHLIAWYHGGQTRIDGLTLEQYLKELAHLVLEKNWVHHIRDRVISSKQGDQSFIDWKIEIENLNAILTTSSPEHALSLEALKVQLEANLNSELKNNLLNEPVLSDKLDIWTYEVKECDKCIKMEDAHTQHLIDANNTACAAKRNDKRNLLQRISKPPLCHNNITRTSTPSTATPRQYLPKLTDGKKKLLDEHDGCTCCRKFYAGHWANECPMKITDTWPDVESYITLTKEKAHSVKTQVPRLPAAASLASCLEYPDDDTDEYVDMPFTTPHLVAKLDAFGPNIHDFPLSVNALLDIGCPSTVISSDLANELGLRRYPLPPEENNLSSLSDTPMNCTEYVKLGLTSGCGRWKSHVLHCKVNVGLLILLILGLPFLLSHHIIINPYSRTAVDSRTDYDLMSPRKCLPSRSKPPTTPLPTPKKVHQRLPVTLDNAPEPALAGYLLPEPIMAAARQRVEVLDFQELL